MSEWPTGITLRPIQQWPGEQTRERKRAPFRRTIPGSIRREPVALRDTLDLLDLELHSIRAKDRVLEIGIREQDFRVDGMPRANAVAQHPGVVLSFAAKAGALRFPCDTFDRWQDNLRAVALALEALRKVDRYGVTRRAEQYAGWRAIEGTPPGERPMTREMAAGILRDLSDVEDVKDPVALRIARARSHPDRHNGDRHLWNNVEQAARILGLTP